MLSVEDLESLEETLAVLSDPEPMAAVRQADAEVAAGGTTALEAGGAGRARPVTGGYRVVYRVDEGRRRVVVLAIGHRADVYRRG